MMSLVTSRGWEALLPDALEDNQLLLVSDQFRDLLSGIAWSGDQDPASAALPLTLLLLSKASAKHSDKSFDIELETLQAALCLLSTAVDREIVNRMLQRRDPLPLGEDLLQTLAVVVQDARQPA
ncbi:hypothetical protein [Acidovorax sp. NCPPB 3576]|uniref:hypothetical protein n=1 Tax=Acidovorax sp. NCPPB 3576 TaxID=2940488 RepID=UPI00234AD7F6|nr:hypothetical protein [Acidovorax sp. NCPPB 3576]WCM90486.1 hypothetical protein M5C98_10920 [Acidovorax sp. NCPPB 3576]